MQRACKKMACRPTGSSVRPPLPPYGRTVKVRKKVNVFSGTTASWVPDQHSIKNVPISSCKKYDGINNKMLIRIRSGDGTYNQESGPVTPMCSMAAAPGGNSNSIHTNSLNTAALLSIPPSWLIPANIIPRYRLCIRSIADSSNEPVRTRMIDPRERKQKKNHRPEKKERAKMGNIRPLSAARLAANI